MLKGAEMLKRAGVPFSAYFMAGFPGETDDDLKETIDLLEKLMQIIILCQFWHRITEQNYMISL